MQFQNIFRVYANCFQLLFHCYSSFSAGVLFQCFLFIIEIGLILLQFYYVLILLSIMMHLMCISSYLYTCIY